MRPVRSAVSGLLLLICAVNVNAQVPVIDGLVPVNCLKGCGTGGAGSPTTDIVAVGGNPVTTSLPVSGIFWQATQPVSFTRLASGTDSVTVTGTVTFSNASINIGNFPSGFNVNNIPHVIVDTAPTTAVTGTFWQATQPVSGTFFQATQPVSFTTPFAVSQSGTWTVQPGNTANSTAWLVTGTGGTFPVTGTFWQATQPVSIAATVAVTAPTLTKGTQGANGFSTQDLKDAGRTLVALTASRVTPILTTDTLVTFSKLVGDTATASVSTYPVTSGKTLRLQSLSISMTPTSTTAAVLTFRLRTLSSGTCIASSPLVGVWEVGNLIGTMAANQGNQREDIMFPDGMEFSGANRNICMSMNVLGAAAQAVTITLVGYEY